MQKIEFNKGYLIVLPTDTLYGIHVSALLPKAVEKLYRLRKRSSQKPFIILISSLDQLKLFGIVLDEKTKKILSKCWPGKVSVILPCSNPKFEYLHRGTKSLAFRLPDKRNLTKIIETSGPLVSTSVNPEGLPPATNIKEAKKYFGDRINLYIDQGELNSTPSTLISIIKGKIKTLRQGEEIIRNE